MAQETCRHTRSLSGCSLCHAVNLFSGSPSATDGYAIERALEAERAASLKPSTPGGQISLDNSPDCEEPVLKDGTLVSNEPLSPNPMSSPPRGVCVSIF
ncbi:hypothetical protein SCP_0601500 [Sparassis crispa]|uniref:Uncharacterized protein n=1 Tax=Sparassis crispa TaxID=139825 RepID=A0A401GPP6_9APHY|nr:hypothetical protein SCP_0601500 [Sparassis crispa]GBE84172.1 hypothetical protein SCP_0601500 [Sparassis crispa]